MTLCTATLRAKLPTKFTISLTNLSGTGLSDNIVDGYTYKLNIYDGTTAKYIGTIKGNTLITCYDAGYEECVKGWFQAKQMGL